MKFKMEDNHLMIYYENGELKEDATENMNECEYCIHDARTCDARSPTSDVRKYGGQFCDTMRCKFDEVKNENK